MKQVILLLFFWTTFHNLRAQEQEAQQLLLNWEKLEQLKSMLQNMYKGYQVLSDGYGTIRDIAAGNFRLHQAFFDSLLQVSPAVKNYYRVADIIRYQKRILEEQQTAWAYFKNNSRLSAEERVQVGKIYSGLLEQSLSSLDDLLLLITAGRLRLSDGERLAFIDKVYEDAFKQWRFLHAYTSSNKQLVLQRIKELAEVARSRRLNNIK